MKFKICFLALLFIAFLATPLVVNIFRSDAERVVITIVEEENTKIFNFDCGKDLFTERGFSDRLTLKLLKKNKIGDIYAMIAYPIYLDLISPPPRPV